jgi:hypothetical protein
MPGEPRPAESPLALERKRSRGIYVLWAAGLVFLLALGAVCWWRYR